MTVFENMMRECNNDIKLVIANTMLTNKTIYNYENTGYTAYPGMDGYMYIDPERKSDSILPLKIDDAIRISKVFTEPRTMVCDNLDDARKRCLQTYMDFLNSENLNDNAEESESDECIMPIIIEISEKEFREKYEKIEDVENLFNPLEVINSQGTTVILPGYFSIIHSGLLILLYMTERFVMICLIHMVWSI